MEKKIRFKKSGGEVLNSITFQVTDVGKPLAAVSKILDKGNTVVLSTGRDRTSASGDRRKA